MTADEIKLLGDSEMETGHRLAIGLGIVAIGTLVIVGSFTAVVIPNRLMYAFFLIVGLGSAAATGVLFWAYRRRNGLMQAFKDLYLPALPAPPAPSTLPLETEQVEAQEESRGGDGRPLHGFDAATLAWLCDCLANGMPWTEATLEKMRVPHMFPPARFGKAEGDTPYNRLFHSERGLFIRAGIIIERGGEGNKPGKLAIRSPLTMMQLLKELPEIP